MNTLMQVNKKVGLTDKYKQVNTSGIISTLVNSGFEVTTTQVTKARKVERIGFERHLVRLKHNDLIISKEERPEIVLINSHDGTSALTVCLGVFRFICSNGVVAGNGFGGFKLNHTGNNIEEDIKQGIDQLVAKDLPKLKSTIESMKSKVLTDNEIKSLADKFADLRLPENKVAVAPNFFAPQRKEDESKDLWTVYNILQERLLRGGIQYTTTVNENKEIKYHKTRPIKAIAEVLRLNIKSFEIAISLVA